jgi:hypothetical protein
MPNCRITFKNGDLKKNIFDTFKIVKDSKGRITLTEIFVTEFIGILIIQHAKVFASPITKVAISSFIIYNRYTSYF